MFPCLPWYREAAVILEKFFGNMHIVHQQNIEGNGRIVIDRAEMKYFSHARCINMKIFSDTVNACTGKVNMLCPDGKKRNINGEEKVQYSLWRQYRQNKNCLRLVLEIPDPADYMSIVSHYDGDC